MTVHKKQITNGETEGVSPKALAAFFYPFAATIAAVLGSWVVTGQWNETEARTAVAGLIASVVAAVGAWLGKTGTVRDA